MTNETTIETSRTATHAFWINSNRYQMGEFIVEFRPLNQKTGEPWQASRRVTHGADIEPKGWEGRPIDSRACAASACSTSGTARQRPPAGRPLIHPELTPNSPERIL